MGRNVERVVRVRLLLLVTLALVPAVASAQSSIAGSVKDTTGGVLPGVAVEAASALNASPVLSQNAVFGPQLGRRNRIFEARLLRIGVRVEF